MGMRAKRSKRFVIALAVAIVTTLLFLISTVFAFGVSTDRSTFLSWNSSTPGFGLVQVLFIYGQFHLTIDFADPNAPSTNRRLHRSPQTIVPRHWHTGIEYAPGVHTELRETDRWISTIGIDGFFNESHTYFSVGLFGLYPSVLLWLLVWLCRGKRITTPGHCPTCGYDLRASPERCPECGAIPQPSAE